MMTCRLLLLGGIGAGKSTVSELLRTRGAQVVDADEIGHEVLANPAVVKAVQDRWPEVVRSGSVERSLLAREVFGRPNELGYLESITHPLIKKEIADRVAEADADLVVVEMPVLKLSLDGDWFVIVVDAPEDVRLERTVRRGISKSDARQRMRSQPSRAEYLDRADAVIDNGGSEDDLSHELDRVLEIACSGVPKAGPPCGWAGDRLGLEPL